MPPNASGQQSTFVTVVAWLALIFAGLALLAGSMQLLLIGMTGLWPSIPVEEASSVPTFFRFVIDNFVTVVIGMTAFYAAVLAGAVGVLQRKEWGRKLFVATVLIAAFGMAGFGAAQQAAMVEMFSDASDIPPDAAAMMRVMRIFAIILTVGFASVAAWIAYRFSKPEVRAEFGR